MRPHDHGPQLACGACGARQLRPHCDSPGCDLKRCLVCRSYGRPGGRWATVDLSTMRWLWA